jgi:hypothetical protein
MGAETHRRAAGTTTTSRNSTSPPTGACSTQFLTARRAVPSLTRIFWARQPPPHSLYPGTSLLLALAKCPASELQLDNSSAPALACAALARPGLCRSARSWRSALRASRCVPRPRPRPRALHARRAKRSPRARLACPAPPSKGPKPAFLCGVRGGRRCAGPVQVWIEGNPALFHAETRALVEKVERRNRIITIRF